MTRFEASELLAVISDMRSALQETSEAYHKRCKKGRKITNHRDSWWVCGDSPCVSDRALVLGTGRIGEIL